jgi:hypothetical protein
MSRVGNVLSRSGLLPPAALEQLRRWGAYIEEEVDAHAPGPRHIGEALEEALQAPAVRELYTDPDLYPRFLRTQRGAVLVLVAHGDSLRTDLLVGRHIDGSWIVPWGGGDPSDVLTNGESHLEVDGVRYFFNEIKEFHHGETKAFLRCFVSCTEQADAPPA